MLKKDLILRLLRVPIDYFSILLAFIVAYYLRLTDFAISQFAHVDESEFFMELSLYLVDYAFLMSLSLLVVFFLNGLYSFKFHDDFSTQIKKIFYSVLVWLAFVVSYFFVIRDFPFSRFVLLAAAILSFVFILLNRIFFLYLEKKFLKIKILFLVNNKKDLKKILFAIQSKPFYQPVGYIAERKFRINNLKFCGNLNNFENILTNFDIDDIVQVGDLQSHFENEDILDLCRYYHKQYVFVPDLLAVQRHNIVLSQILGIPFFKIKPTALDGWGRVVKRCVDFICSLFGLILLSPIFLIIAILIKIDSKGPVFFKYDDNGNVLYRSGGEGKPFYCYKFRTMYVKTHSQRYDVLKVFDIRKDSPLVKIKNDPRITRLGRFLRKFDLDELPQLFNVLKGEMSLIGPRPHLVEEVSKYKLYHRFVLTIKPGITGLSQVSGRSDLDFEEEVKLDTYYIENWSLWLDFKIILKTIVVVFQGHGEYKN